VLGSFRIEEIYEDAPEELWVKTKAFAGVTKEMFDRYFKDKVRAFAIKVSNPIRFSHPQPLSKYVPSNNPPQSFCYIRDT
jgi:predicted transcriptional regulator